MLFAHVHHGDRQAEYAARRVVQPVVGHRPGVFHVGGAARAADGEFVEDRGARGQDLTHRGRDGFRVQERKGLADAAADVLLGGQGVDTFQRGVDHHVAKIRVQDREPDGRLGHELHGQREVPLDAAQERTVAGDAQSVDVPELVVEPHVAELHQAGAAVLVAYGEDACPAPAALHDLGEQAEDEVDVLRGDQKLRGTLPERLLGGEPEQFLGLGAPQADPALGVDHHRGNRQGVQKAAGLGYRARRQARPRRTDRIHPDTSPESPGSEGRLKKISPVRDVIDSIEDEYFVSRSPGVWCGPDSRPCCLQTPHGILCPFPGEGHMRFLRCWWAAPAQGRWVYRAPVIARPSTAAGDSCDSRKPDRGIQVTALVESSALVTTSGPGLTSTR